MKQFFSLAAALLISVTAFAQDHDHDQMAGHLVFKNNSLHIRAVFEQPPAVGVEAHLVLQAVNPATHQMVGLSDKIEVELWMPSMHHGSSPTYVEAAPYQAGLFYVRDVFFIMSGDWEIRVTLTNEIGETETQSFVLNLGDDDGSHGH